MDVFDRVWDRLARRGSCVARGGVEYGRVRAWWVLRGRPRPIARFILREANRRAPHTYAELTFTAGGWRRPDGKLYGDPLSSTNQ